MRSGDYIPRDDGKVAAWEILESMGYSSKHNDRLVEEVDAVFDEIPAADVRPVARGKWEDVRVRDYSTNINGGMELHIATMFCPVCGRWHNEVYHYGIATEMVHFCPNCGADMREES